MKKKLKVGIVSLTSCEGCQIAILTLGQRLLDLSKNVDFLEFSYLEDKEWPKSFDVAFIEGTPITKKQLKTLKQLRKKAKLLIVIGNCAALGGVHEIKNYGDKEKIIKSIYRNQKGIANPDIKEIDNFVKVDFTIPGCPINPEEFLTTVNQILGGQNPEIKQISVCQECPRVGKKECFLLQKKVCFGPWVLGGCQAPCPKNDLICLACRGFKKDADLFLMKKSLERFVQTEEIEKKLEIFGLLDEFREKIKNKK